MDECLNILIIEDSEDDAKLVVRELLNNDIQLNSQRIQTVNSLHTQLENSTWDVIIADYCVPGLEAPIALETVQQSQLDIPFIVVSGAIGEQVAVEMIKAGAHDYLMKDNLTRLPEAVRREVREAQIRKDRRQAEVILKRQQVAIEAVIDGIAILLNDIYLYANPAYLNLFGYEHSGELLGKSWDSLYSVEEATRFRHEIFPVLEQEQAWQGETIARRKDGSTFVQGVSLSLAENETLIVVCRDISELKQAQPHIAHNALHDPLTNLPNRALLLERLDLAIKKAQRYEDYRYAVLFLDLDRFKVINDSLGHLIGDKLLIGIAQRLKIHLRNTDMVARLGGDEFVILLEESSSEETVIEIVNRIIKECQTPFDFNKQKIFSSVSIGIVLETENYLQAEELLRDADIAMYQAKKDENHAYKIFNKAMYIKAFNRLTLETDLRKALEQGEFVLHYQPIFDLFDNQLMGFEALVRWQHPIHGLISPTQFVPIAEETGLIIPLDGWVIRQACQQVNYWEKKFPRSLSLKVSINLSAKDFRKPSLIQEIDILLTEKKLEGALITIEITESMLMDNLEKTIDVLNQLKSRNIQISIDDFGTGYSSLSYLNRLPIDNLKIDRSFVNQMQADKRDYQIVNTITALSRQLGLVTIAEGIETPRQLSLLKQLDCQLGQGYFFSEPLPADEIENRILYNTF
ncbi:EAL domain-containing protein [Acaryochloris sp. IP29b_bin.148]|uniref:EAL domain-containing response regulator n=1 Tax=Acaryochloris sp. IP29b_bin.148 TaxID=2969218 RepID=UPI0026126287|nr:EAL domain-containing protein [Acaryochloris sp. IP29b_bin.148]